MPVLPYSLYEDEGKIALAFFDRLRLPDVVGNPTMGEACGPWFRDIVYMIFASRNPETNERYLRELFALVGKGNSKTTYSAGLMLTALFMNVRRGVELLFVGPTQAISDIAFDSAKGMIELDEDLQRRFKVIEHQKHIKDRVLGSKLKVKTFDLTVLTGPKPAAVMIDEIHLLGKSVHTAKVLRQIRGGLEKNTDGFLLFVTTQSDDIPAGAFKTELQTARAIRDGRQLGRMLPILWEFPPSFQRDEKLWGDPKNWPLVIPNLGRSLRLDSLVADYNAECRKGEKEKRLWASQHISIEIGVALQSDQWPGAIHWAKGADPDITFESLLEDCEVIIPGLDGGGLDDLYGLTMLGRHKVSKDWLAWQAAWCFTDVLYQRELIANKLYEFRDAGELRILEPHESGLDIIEICDMIRRVKEKGILGPVAVDPAGLGEMVEELTRLGLRVDKQEIIGVQQGFAMMNALKTAERKLANGTLRHNGSLIGAWCVSNIKIEPMATAIRATKQNAGDAKIDVAMSLFNAVFMMAKEPQPISGTRKYQFMVY